MGVICMEKVWGGQFGYILSPTAKSVAVGGGGGGGGETCPPPNDAHGWGGVGVGMGEHYYTIILFSVL